VSFFILAGKGARRPSTLHWLATFGAPGVFGMSLVDASIIPLAIPGSTDLLLLWLISRGGNPYVLVGCAVAGSIIGGWTTWRVGKKGGDAAIGRYASLHLQKRVRG
jgi:membrane protein YqaA with SNARE-associated domain